ncbi:HD domain-containing protein [Candidatus Woesearchaeota archaeon]|nr:HD domain-containing protein [Candidatus Woesearchaeota archaeon]
MEDKDILNFIFELGQLRRVDHEGFKLIGVEHPETVAEHTLRAAQIGFILAKIENYNNPYEVCTMVVFHDIGECRIGDIHKVANRYVKADEELAVKEQLAKLGDLGSNIFSLWKQIENKGTVAGIIAKDADLLEQAVTAKEYLEKGYEFAQDWINNVNKRLKTKSAQKLILSLKEIHSNDWWQGLKKIPQ